MSQFKCYYRHVSLNDFEYSYKIFTPLENLTENGVVIKHIYRNRFDLDSELSLKLAAFNVSFFYLKTKNNVLIDSLGKSNFNCFCRLDWNLSKWTTKIKAFTSTSRLQKGFTIPQHITNR